MKRWRRNKALGAGASDLLRLVLTKGLALTAGGVVLGLVAALQVTRLLGYLLYKVSPRDADGSASRAARVMGSRHAIPQW
jgi:hypothetical protein